MAFRVSGLIEEGYHSTNPYHNSIHATDVTQAMHCFLQEKKVRVVRQYFATGNRQTNSNVITFQIREHLTPLEIMASLIAAVTHDLDHPGVNQPFLIATSNHLAALYEVSRNPCHLSELLFPRNFFPPSPENELSAGKADISYALREMTVLKSALFSLIDKSCYFPLPLSPLN